MSNIVFRGLPGGGDHLPDDAEGYTAEAADAEIAAADDDALAGIDADLTHDFLELGQWPETPEELRFIAETEVRRAGVFDGGVRQAHLRAARLRQRAVEAEPAGVEG